MPKVLRYAARSDMGKIRSKNDDSAYVGQHLAVVADGMGGHAGGDVASASTVLDLIHLDREGYAGDAGTVLADEIQTANSLLSELVHDNPKLAGMGTTVTALLLAGDKIEFAHIGDSRAYRLKDGVFEQISVDHTFVQRLIDEGRLRPEEAETHPHKNVLMRVLGDVDASPELDLASFEASAGERWLLCSDGLNAVVPTATVEDVLRNTSDIRQCVERLVEMTLDGGSPDNVTVAVIEVAEATGDDVRTDALAVVEPGAGAARTGLHPLAAAAAAGSASAPASTSTESAAAEKPADGGTADSEGDGENLGGHLVAAVLREELSSRPHELVGAAATAAEAGSIPAVAGRAASRRAATVLTHKTASRRHEPEDDALMSLPRRGRPWVRVAVAAVLLLALVAGGVIGYAWTQSRYYVGVSEGKVAIYNGVSQNLGPIPLSHLQSTTEIAVSSLSEFSQQRVQQTVPASSLTDAQQIVKNLQSDTGPAAGCPAPTGSPGPTASPKPTASASAHSSAKAAAKPSTKPSAKPSATPTAEASAKASATPTAAPSPSSSASPCAGGTP